MYQDGLIYKDNISFTGSESDDMFKAGQAFAAYNVAGSLNSWSDDMMRAGVIERKDALAPAVVYGMDGKWYMTQTEDYWCVTAFNHKITMMKMDRALMFWNFLNSTGASACVGWASKAWTTRFTGETPEDVEVLWDLTRRPSPMSLRTPTSRVHPKPTPLLYAF